MLGVQYEPCGPGQPVANVQERTGQGVVIEAQARWRVYGQDGMWTTLWGVVGDSPMALAPFVVSAFECGMCFFWMVHHQRGSGTYCHTYIPFFF